MRARDAGMDVVYDGIRLTPAEIVDAARSKDVHVVGLSILSGSHLPLVEDVVRRLRDAGLDGVPVVVGGIIPPQDADRLMENGVAAVYTPKDFELNRVMSDVLRIVERGRNVVRGRASMPQRVRVPRPCPGRHRRRNRGAALRRAPVGEARRAPEPADDHRRDAGPPAARPACAARSSTTIGSGIF